MGFGKEEDAHSRSYEGFDGRHDGGFSRFHILESNRIEKIWQDGADDGDSRGPEPEGWVSHQDFKDIAGMAQRKHRCRSKGKGIKGNGQRVVAAQGKAAKNGIQGVEKSRRQPQGQCWKRYGQMPLEDACHENAARNGTHQGQPFPARHPFMEDHR